MELRRTQRQAVATLVALTFVVASCNGADRGPSDKGTDVNAGNVGAGTPISGAGAPVGGVGSNAAGSGQPAAGAGASGAAGASSAAGASGAAGTGTSNAPDSGTAPGDAGADAGNAVDAGGDIDPGDDDPALGTVEDSGADCPVPALPPVAQLSPFAKHHDPFTSLDGSRIGTKAQWRCRRAEIKAQVEQYESGPKPRVAPENVSAQLSGNSLAITVSEGGKSIRFTVTINRPSGASSGPAPVSIAFGFATLDQSVFAQNGVATIILDIDALGAQSGGGSRGTGLFYDLYGREHPASSMVAWAWGVSRIIDALEQTPEANLDPRRVAVTGCSRYGKGALLAGALDERVVLTIPQESGAGGSASWRVSQAQSQMGENVQTLSSAAGEQPWFRADFGRNFGGSNVVKLPFDHHMVMGLVAPRALLVLDNRIDWLGIDSTFTAGSIAHAIWEAFGLGDHMGYWQTGGHTHCRFPPEQRGILDAYVKKFLVGTGEGDTDMLRADGANADLAYWMEWTPPALQ